MHITFFGTGAALTPHCDNTYFMIEKDGKNLFVDSGGGMELQKKIMRKEVPAPQNLFLTHCHTDHFLGVPHLLRKIKQPLKIFLAQELFGKLQQLIEIVGITKRVNKLIDEQLLSHQIIEEGKEYDLDFVKIRPINLYSKKSEQFGFSLSYDDKKLVFFGDEAIDVMQRKDLDLYTGCDVLLCESLCLESQKEKEEPAKKAHITAKETGMIAKRLEAKKLFVVHYAEKLGGDRKQQSMDIREEAGAMCSAEVIVPLDGESFEV